MPAKGVSPRAAALAKQEKIIDRARAKRDKAAAALAEAEAALETLEEAKAWLGVRPPSDEGYEPIPPLPDHLASEPEEEQPVLPIEA